MTIKNNFLPDEIKVISRYVLANVPYSILEQVFPLTENPMKKAEVFTIMYRIITSCKNYVREEETKGKLNLLLNSCSKEYNEMHVNLIKLKSDINFGKHFYEKNIEDIFSCEDSNEKINILIDMFLIFAEKHTMQDINKIVGINTEEIASNKIMDEMSEMIGD